MRHPSGRGCCAKPFGMVTGDAILGVFRDVIEELDQCDRRLVVPDRGIDGIPAPAADRLCFVVAFTQQFVDCDRLGKALCLI